MPILETLTAEDFLIAVSLKSIGPAQFQQDHEADVAVSRSCSLSREIGIKPRHDVEAAMLTEEMAGVPKRSEPKYFKVRSICDEGNWEPVTYAPDWGQGNYTYVTCRPHEASHVRHTETGKQYRFNQLSRIIGYEYDLKFNRK